MICGHGVLSLYDLWAEMKEGHLDWRAGDKKTKSNPLWMVVDYLDLVTGGSSKVSLDRAQSSGPSVVLWHSCQFVSIQPDFTKHKSNHFQMEWEKHISILLFWCKEPIQLIRLCWLDIPVLLIISDKEAWRSFEGTFIGKDNPFLLQYY